MGLRFWGGIFGAATGNPARNMAGLLKAGAAECVCRKKKAQGFVLRESRDSLGAVNRLLADQIALAFHRGINL